MGRGIEGRYDCETCNVPGPCNPRHYECTLDDDEQAELAWERGDDQYHAMADWEAER